MEEQIGQPQVVVADHNGALAGSFEARMKERRNEREQRTTEFFEPPGFEDLFRVEMQVLAYTVISDIVMAHQRQRNETMKNLYINADIVLKATVGFYLVKDDESLDLIEDGNWTSVARVMYPELDAMTKPRVAMIRLLEGQGIAELAAAWNEWNTRGNTQIERELRADFSVTR